MKVEIADVVQRPGGRESCAAERGASGVAGPGRSPARPAGPGSAVYPRRSESLCCAAGRRGSSRVLSGVWGTARGEGVPDGRWGCALGRT